MGKREAGTIYISIQLATEAFSKGVQGIQRSLGKLQKDFTKMGQTLSLSFALPFAAFSRTAVKAFSDFDKAMSDSIAVMGGVDKAMKEKLEKRATEISNVTTFTAAEVAKGYESLAQSGFTAEQSLGAIGAVTKFAAAGSIDLRTASDQLATAMTALGMKTGDVAQDQQNLLRIGNALVAANFDGTASTEDFAQALGSKLAGVIRLVGFDVEQAAAALAVLAKNGVKGRDAATQLSIVLRDLQIKSLKNADAFKANGIAVFDQTGKMRNLAFILKDLEGKMNGMSTAQKTALLQTLGFTQKNISSLQAMVGFGAELDRVTAKIKEQGDLLGQVAAQKYQSFEAQVQMLQNRLTNFARLIGAELAPMILRIGDFVVQLADAFNNLGGTTKRVVIEFGAALAILGPLAAILAIVSIKAIAIGAAIAAIGVAAYEFSDEVVAGFQAAWVGIKAFFEGLSQVASEVWDYIKEAASGFFNWITTAFSNTFPELSKWFSILWETAGIAFDAIIESVGSFVESFGTYFEAIKEGGSFAFKVLAEMGAIAFDLIGQAVSGFVSWFAETFPGMSNIAEAIWDGFTEYARVAIETVKGWIDGLVQAFSYVQAKVGELFSYVSGKAASIGSNVSSAVSDTFKQKIEENAKAADDAAKASEERLAKTRGILDTVLGKFNGETGITRALQQVSDSKGFPTLGEKAEGAAKKTKKVADETKKVADAMGDLNQKLRDIQNDKALESLNRDLENAIEAQNRTKFDDLKEQIRRSTYEGALIGLEDAVSKTKGAGQEIANQIAGSKADAEVAKLEAKYTEAGERASDKISKKTKEDLTKAHEDSVKAWEDVFGNAIKGTSFDLEDTFERVLVGLAAQIADAVSGGFGDGVRKAQDIGGNLGKTIIDSVSSWFGGGEQQPFFGPGGDPSGSGQGQAPTSAAVANDSGGYVVAGIQALSALYQGFKNDKGSKDNRAIGGGAGAVGGGAIGAVFGGPAGAMIGAQIGQQVGGLIGSFLKKGAQNPETQARHAFSNFIEDSFKKLDTIAFFDVKGQLKTLDAKSLNFLEGSSKKFNGEWGDTFNEVNATAKNVFSGLGQALEETLGLTEDVGTQIGAMLAENLGGNIDNARLLVQQLGLDMEDMQNKLVEAGLRGEMSWHEVEVALQGVNEAFGKGLAAVGDIKGAYDELVNSGGRGVAALKAVRDLAVEALEQNKKAIDDANKMPNQVTATEHRKFDGVPYEREVKKANEEKKRLLDQLQSIEQIRDKLLTAGVSPDEVNNIMNALKQRGIETLQQLAESSDRVVGGIVADIQSGSSAMANTWESMANELDALKGRLNDLPTAIQSNVTLNVDAKLTDDAKKVLDSGAVGNVDIPGITDKMARGGVLKGPTLIPHSKGFGLAGEAGAEGILPLTSVGGKLGVHALGMGGGSGGGTSVNFHIDARGAAPGTEARVMRVLREMEGRIVNQAVNATFERGVRGGRYGD